MSRLANAFFLILTAILGLNRFSRNLATSFLQGQGACREPHRVQSAAHQCFEDVWASPTSIRGFCRAPMLHYRCHRALRHTGGADNMTAIKTSVTQDNLGFWVPFNLTPSQKNSAALLKAEGLRTHVTQVKANPKFVASKKKDPAAQKAGREAHARMLVTGALQAASFVTGAEAEPFMSSTPSSTWS